MTPASFTITQARIHFPGLIHDAEKGKPVEITRRGKPVAMLISADAYRHWIASRPRFWDVVSAFRNRTREGKVGWEPRDLRDLRETGPGRDFKG